MKRLNITLPEGLYEELKPVPNKSRFISEAIKNRLEREKKEKLDKLLVKGYKATNDEDKKLNEEWEYITLEKWS
jgi:metal-responsive CopG/Arc/MetJ family transcriptional regulator